MKANLTTPFRTAVGSLAFSLVLGTTMLFAQDPQDQPPQPPPPDAQQQAGQAAGGWRRVDQPGDSATQAAPPAQSTAPQQAPQQAPPPPPADASHATMDPNYSQGPAYPSQQYPNQPYPNQPYPNQPYPNQPYSNQPYPQAARGYDRGPIPAKLTINPGTYITVRLNQGLSSDHNKDGDAFAATLVKPVIVNGVVVANRGQTVGGRVVEAKKAGRVEGTSRLVVQLTDFTLADGQPVPIQTQLFSRNGPTSVGRDVGAVGATTATGAAIGAAADWGRGAAIGAGAGALAGIVGVLVTRGRPTVLYPEEILTFRVQAPVAISTESAPQAFRWVTPADYDTPYGMQARPRPAGYPYGPYAYPYAYPYAGYPYYPYYWGPSFGLYWGRGYWGRGYWGRWR